MSEERDMSGLPKEVEEALLALRGAGVDCGLMPKSKVTELALGIRLEEAQAAILAALAAARAEARQETFAEVLKVVSNRADICKDGSANLALLIWGELADLRDAPAPKQGDNERERA